MLDRLRRRLLRNLASDREDSPYGKCFISHSYRDVEAIETLKDCLPDSVRPHVFPIAHVSPEEMVSTTILADIRCCDTLIYVRGSYSQESGWVTLERDYANRAGLDVYVYDVEARTIFRDPSRALELPIFALFPFTRPSIIDRVLKVLARRSFTFAASVDTLRDETWQEDFIEAADGCIRKGGFIAPLVTGDPSGAQMWELKAVMDRYADRSLAALIEKPSLPEAFKETPQLAVPLGRVDGKTIDWRRLDDLIVRLYWLIYRTAEREGRVSNFFPSVPVQ